MALDTHAHFIYPPEYQSGDYPKGNGKLGPKRWCVQFIGIGTASEEETDVRKIVLSDLITVDGKTPSKFVVDCVSYEIRGFTGIYLKFDRIPKHNFFTMGGANSGQQCWDKYGGHIDDGEGGTGDILLTTVGGDQYDTYNIQIEFRVM